MQHRVLLLSTLLTLLASGCGWLGAGSGATRTTASLTVNNLSDLPICDVHFAERGNRIDETEDALLWYERIDPGGSQTFGVEAGEYAMRMCDCEGGVLYGQRHMRIVAARRLDFRPLEVMRRGRIRNHGVAQAHPPSRPRASF